MSPLKWAKDGVVEISNSARTENQYKVRGRLKVPMQIYKRCSTAATLLVASMSLIQPLSTQERIESVPDPGAITTHQTITPAGVQSVFAGRVDGAAFCGSDSELTVAVEGSRTSTVYRLGVLSNKILAEQKYPEQWFGIQGMACVPLSGETLLSMGNAKSEHVVELLSAFQATAIPGTVNGGTTTSNGKVEGDAWWTAAKLSGTLTKGAIGGVGVAAGARIAAAALTASNEIAVIDLGQERITKYIPVGIAPFSAAVSDDGKVAWVSNWGGRVPKSNERTAPAGSDSKTPDQVLIDARGIAASGTVSRVDLVAGRVTNEVAVGLHPTALVLDAKRSRLYVANGNGDSISVIDTTSSRVVATWEIQPFMVHVNGVAPTSIVLSPDGSQLYVACGGINAVAVLGVTNGMLAGLIPTGWYPSQVTISPNGKLLAVSTLLGVGSGQLTEEIAKRFRNEQPNLQLGIMRRYVHSYRGTVHVIPVPEKMQLGTYTRIVAENSHLRLRSDSPVLTSKPSVPPPAMPVPERSGDPSLIEHAVYIVKENRAYDQIFGDLDRGNGDASLMLYGEDCTPNHHRLAREFVVLDNFYATGGDSGDGHQWVTQASETDYAYWPGYSGRSYPFDGDDPIAYAKGGFLWDAVLKARKSFADFGEFIPAGQYAEIEKDPNYHVEKLRSDLLQQWKSGDQFIHRFNVSSPIPPLDAHLVRDYPSYGAASPDVVRARIFLRHLQEWEKSGTMPSLTYIQLPSDHTSGTKADHCIPKACLADNDLALGQIVEGLTHSKFWPHMAIYVVEDDAQGGVDHVDGHRTVALAISPYIRHHSVDSTFYSHPSIARTIELQLGLGNLSIFDLIANDMRNSFTQTPDFTPYTAVIPKQSIFETNPQVQSLSGQVRKDAIASAKMNWSVPDAAPAKKLLEILWRNAKGPNLPVRHQQNAVFLPFAPRDEDDDGDDGLHPVTHADGHS